MCFEFEALYWAKIAEDEQKRREAEQQANQVNPAPAPQRPAEQQQPVPA